MAQQAPQQLMEAQRQRAASKTQMQPAHQISGQGPDWLQQLPVQEAQLAPRCAAGLLRWHMRWML